MTYVESKYEWIESLGKIPFIGFFFLIIFSALPGAALAIISFNFYELSDLEFKLSAFTIYPFWNYFLINRGIKIYIFFIRADLFWLGLGLLVFVFQVID